MTEQKVAPSKSRQILVNRYFPYVSSFIIFLGIVRLMIFYIAFGVPIIQFLEFTEIITSFLDITAIAVILLCYVILKNFFTGSYEERQKFEDQIKIIFAETNPFKRGFLYLKLLKEPLLIFIAGFVILIIYSFFDSSISFHYVLLAIALIFLLIAYIIAYNELERKHMLNNSNSGRRRYIGIVFTGFLSVTIVVILAYFQANTIKRKHTTLGTEVVLENKETLLSDSLTYYVGNTKNYLFIYHAAESRTEVIPMVRVQKITLAKKVKSNSIFDNIY